MIISRLLRCFAPADFCLISRQNIDEIPAEQSYSKRLPANFYHLRPEHKVTRGARFSPVAKAYQHINIPFGIILRSRRIAEILKRENCRAVVATSGDLLDIPAAYLASRRLRIPFYAYLFDHYSYREWVDPVAQWWARRLEPIVLKGAAAVIAPNEILRDDLRQRFGLEAKVIHNSCELAQYEEAARVDVPAKNGNGLEILYTGDVYEAHYDAFQNLMAAIKLIERENIKLHLYTAQPPEELAKKGISGPIVFHQHVDVSAMPGIQRRAGLLFLPLAFDSPYPDLVRTSATSKLGEYLAARRPIIAHAPPDSFISWYFRQHQCGLVVDERNPAKLSQAIERILSDADLRRQMSARAWERAQADFSISTAQHKFKELIREGRAC